MPICWTYLSLFFQFSNCWLKHSGYADSPPLSEDFFSSFLFLRKSSNFPSIVLLLRRRGFLLQWVPVSSSIVMALVAEILSLWRCCYVWIKDTHKSASFKTPFLVNKADWFSQPQPSHQTALVPTFDTILEDLTNSTLWLSLRTHS